MIQYMILETCVHMDIQVHVREQREFVALMEKSLKGDGASAHQRAARTVRFRIVSYNVDGWY